VTDYKPIFTRYPRERRHALAILQDVQRKYNYVPRDALTALAEYLGVKVAGLYSMATFYRALSLRPKGRHIIRVCDGTACHLRGAPSLLDAVERSLRIKPGEVTPDGEWSLETVNCVGACALAPVLVVDGVYHPKTRQDKVADILNAH
jgi:NADH-quinone oxidoreductase subunit E